MKWLAFALFFALTACSTDPVTVSESEKLHFQTTPADYAALGLNDVIEPREDGRRTVTSHENFEWWYFDALLDDGTVLVVWFGDNWIYGSHKRTVSIELTVPGRETRAIRRSFDEPGSFSTTSANVVIGPHTFRGNLDTYSIHVDANDTGGLGCDLLLQRRVPSFRPGTGYISAGNKYFAWLAAVPEGKVSGTLTIDNLTRHVFGSGYHDHNWGNVSPADLFDGWWWGRGQTGEHTVIASVLHVKPAFGGHNLPIMFIGNRKRIEVNGLGSEVNAIDGPPVPHPDPQHVRKIPSSVAVEVPNGSLVRFNISDRTLTSHDLLSGLWYPKRLVARALGLEPWYTRFESSVSTSLPGQPIEAGSGTLEFFELK